MFLGDLIATLQELDEQVKRTPTIVGDATVVIKVANADEILELEGAVLYINRGQIVLWG